jgi:acetate kinase
MYILTLNCGSSSLKYQVYNWEKSEILARGIVERVGIGNSFICHDIKGKDEIKIDKDCRDHKEAINLIIQTLTDKNTGVLSNINDIKAVGHRIVHGGTKFAKSVIITDKAIEAFKSMIDLSPLHNPANITGIEAAKGIMPDIPHCAVMDTAWHQSIPEKAFMYSLPYSWYRNYNIRRYGFHGTSFLYVSKRASVLLGKDPFKTNLICLHIGNGASANAVKNGISVDTSMGMSPLEGLVMGTRSGDHDPAIDYYIMRKENLSPEELENILNKKSGLLGITEKYSDFRDILNASRNGDKQCELAVELTAYRIRKYIGAYYAVLGELDAVVFTAGIGEMTPLVREKALQGLQNLGIIIDKKKNGLSMTRNAETDITGKGSKVRVFVIPTDEELVMTEDTHALISDTYDIHTNFTYSFQNREYKNAEREEALEKELLKNPEIKKIIAKAV